MQNLKAVTMGMHGYSDCAFLVKQAQPSHGVYVLVLVQGGAGRSPQSHVGCMLLGASWVGYFGPQVSVSYVPVPG
jgi:hypothetical protein